MNHQRKRSDSSLKLPPISAIDDFLPTRTWAPPPSSTVPPPPPTPPQPDHQWKSPPYNSRNELSRDTFYKSSLFPSPPPLPPPSSQATAAATAVGVAPNKSPQQRSSYFQYTSKAYHTNNASSPSYNHMTYTPNRIENDIEEVVRQCNTLCDNMVQRKSQFIQSTITTSDQQETRPWLDDMIGRANEVLNALLRLRKHQMASEQLRAEKTNVPDPYQADYVSNEQQQQQQQQQQNKPHTWRIGSSSPSSSSTTISNTNIRQRKRGKRPAFQGRCHSCNISETPEWRRGPDGARTLCNACGLHYAKLARKQQENRGMSNHILGVRRLSHHHHHHSNSNSKYSPPIVDDIILDSRSPTS